jgi:hypothetical protein
VRAFKKSVADPLPAHLFSHVVEMISSRHKKY